MNFVWRLAQRQHFGLVDALALVLLRVWLGIAPLAPRGLLKFDP